MLYSLSWLSGSVPKLSILICSSLAFVLAGLKLSGLGFAGLGIPYTQARNRGRWNEYEREACFQIRILRSARIESIQKGVLYHCIRNMSLFGVTFGGRWEIAQKSLDKA